MDIGGKHVLILGGYGLVGQAAARRLIREKPRRITLLSLKREEAEDARSALAAEAEGVELVAAWGDVFTFTDLKDRPRPEVFDDPALRRRIIESLLDPLTEANAAQYFVYRLITEARPDVIVDAVNTATGIAYQDIYKTSRLAYDALRSGADLEDSLERLLVTDYVPQLIRHVQVLYQSMVKAGTAVYIKIGTSGTGGMGLNIPYTHSEEKPSRVLLSKSALAGAHTLLLFLMARTPGGPITKEIKPAAAIAWKRIGYGPVLRGGRPVPLVEVDLDEAIALVPGSSFRSFDPARGRSLGGHLENVFIDTGENGIFSLEEFAAITTGEQMEFVTPEEIADVVVRELQGGNTGRDVINALDNAVMGPTYRAGLMRHWALEKLRALEKEKGARSVAFENLGPPRLSKLLFEADLLAEAFTHHGRGACGRPGPSVRAHPWPPPRESEEAERDRLHRHPHRPPRRARPARPRVQDPRGGRAHRHPPRDPRGLRGVGPRRLGGLARGQHGPLEGALPPHRGRGRVHSRRRQLLALPPRPAVLGRGGIHPARQDRGLDLRHRGQGRPDEVRQG